MAMVRMSLWTDEPGNVRCAHVGFSNLVRMNDPGMLQACLCVGQQTGNLRSCMDG